MHSKEKLYIYTGEAIHKSSLHPIQLDTLDVVRIDSTFSWTTKYLIVRPVTGEHTTYSVYLEDLIHYEEFPEDDFESVGHIKLKNNGKKGR
jgi:hypothetical protein